MDPSSSSAKGGRKSMANADLETKNLGSLINHPSDYMTQQEEHKIKKKVKASNADVDEVTINISKPATKGGKKKKTATKKKDTKSKISLVEDVGLKQFTSTQKQLDDI